jgi:hypothetical protein
MIAAGRSGNCEATGLPGKGVTVRGRPGESNVRGAATIPSPISPVASTENDELAEADVLDEDTSPTSSAITNSMGKNHRRHLSRIFAFPCKNILHRIACVVY